MSTMYRCSSCGQTVVEFTAKCSNCGKELYWGAPVKEFVPTTQKEDEPLIDSTAQIPVIIDNATSPIPRLLFMQKALMDVVPHDIPPELVRSLTAGKGLMEETLEYLNSIGTKPWRPNPLPREKQVEEMSDMLHFFLELIILSPSHITWEEIVAEYPRKWKTNLERYAKGKAGNWDWDDRATKEEL